MKPVSLINRAWIVALLSIFVTAPAWAITPLSEISCDDPSAADQDVQVFLEEFPIDTSDFEEKDCSRLCKEVGKLCVKNVKVRAKCVKTNDSVAFKLAAALCDRDRQCLDDVKDERSLCKEDLSDLASIGSDRCVDLALSCFNACQAGQVFPGGPQ